MILYLHFTKPSKYILTIVFALLSLLCQAQKSKHRLEADLKNYQENLALLRKRNANSYDMSNIPFFLFGMGNRKKLVYESGELKDALTGTIKKMVCV